MAGGFLVALMFPGLLGQIRQYVGYAVGGIGWLALPVFVLLLAARVFTDDRAHHDHHQPHRPIAEYETL